MRGVYMKAIRAYYLARKHGLVHKDLSFRDFKWAKKLIWPEIHWDEYIKAVMFSFYLSDTYELPPDGIYIPEVKFKVGGTMHVKLRRKEEAAGRVLLDSKGSS